MLLPVSRPNAARANICCQTKQNYSQFLLKLGTALSQVVLLYITKHVLVHKISRILLESQYFHPINIRVIPGRDMNTV